MNFEDRYGRIDRVLHRIAFAAGTAQQAVADVEDILHREVIEAVSLETPVFLTALPRSGTTILLKLLWSTDRFATHTYRDMPFVLCPVLWSRFSRHFAVDDRAKERAHGDGLTVSAESPEAFEEMIWKHFWPEHYQGDRILPWSDSDRKEEFNGFLENHMRKLVVLRREDASDDRRYLSKNNLNVSRLAAPPRPLRRGQFLVPFREPVQQAASMHRQHERFLRIHTEDDFVRRYMEAIGHHEFGKGLQPVDFGGWLTEAPPPTELEFWVRYWTAAYRFVLDHAGASTSLVSYERLTEEPEPALAQLADVVRISEADLTSQAGRVRPPRTHEVDESSISGSVLTAASRIYDRLRQEAAV